MYCKYHKGFVFEYREYLRQISLQFWNVTIYSKIIRIKQVTLFFLYWIHIIHNFWSSKVRSLNQSRHPMKEDLKALLLKLLKNPTGFLKLPFSLKFVQLFLALTKFPNKINVRKYSRLLIISSNNWYLIFWEFYSTHTMNL